MQAAQDSYKLPTNTVLQQTWNPVFGTSRTWIAQSTMYRGRPARNTESGLALVFI